MHIPVPEIEPVGVLPYEGPWIQIEGGLVAKEPIGLPIIDMSPYVDDPLATKNENNAARALKAAYYNKAKNKLIKALFIASQSQTARVHMERAKKAGYVFHIENNSLIQSAQLDDGQTGQTVTKGFVSHDDRIISLSADLSLPDLVRTIDHEMRHASFAPTTFWERLGNAIFEPRDADWTPAAFLQRTLAREADAPAFEIQCAYERLVGDRLFGFKNAPQNQCIYRDGFAFLRQHRPQQVRVYLETLPADGPQTGLGMARVHESMYRDMRWRAAYEQHMCRFYETMDSRHIRSSYHLINTAPSNDPQRVFKWGKFPYLEYHTPNIDYNKPELLSVNKATWERLEKIQRIRRTTYSGDLSPNAKEDPWQIHIRDLNKPEELPAVFRSNRTKKPLGPFSDTSY